MGSGREAGSVALTDAHGPSFRSLKRARGELGDHEGAGYLRARGGAWEVTSSRHYAGSAVCCGLGGARAWGEGRSRAGRASRAKAGSIRRRSARPAAPQWEQRVRARGGASGSAAQFLAGRGASSNCKRRSVARWRGFDRSADEGGRSLHESSSDFSCRPSVCAGFVSHIAAAEAGRRFRLDDANKQRNP
jgi:hypothetical protein